MDLPRRVAALLLLAACAPEPSPEAPVASAAPSASVPPPTTASATASAPLAEAAPSASVAPPAKVDFEASVRRFVTGAGAAWAAHDAAAIAAQYAPSASFTVVGREGLVDEKPEARVKELQAGFKAFPDFDLRFTRVIARAPYAVLEWTATGTHSADFGTQRATGKKTGYRGASLITLGADGQVVHETVYFDVATSEAQLGLGPKGQRARPVEKRPASEPVLVFAGDKADEGLARRWLAIAGSSDGKALGELAADDIVVSNQYMPADTKGKKALAKELADGAKGFVDQSSTVVVCVPTEHVTACEYVWRATWKNAAMGMKPTGKTGTVHSLELIEQRGGKVVRTTAYASSAEFAASFGLADAGSPTPAER